MRQKGIGYKWTFSKKIFRITCIVISEEFKGKNFCITKGDNCRGSVVQILLSITVIYVEHKSPGFLYYCGYTTMELCWVQTLLFVFAGMWVRFYFSAWSFIAEFNDKTTSVINLNCRLHWLLEKKCLNLVWLVQGQLSSQLRNSSQMLITWCWQVTLCI